MSAQSPAPMSGFPGLPDPAQTSSPVRPRPLAELEAGLERIRQSPAQAGVLELIVRRPRVAAREVLTEAMLDLAEGLVGDSWKARGSSSTPNRAANIQMQLTVMNARVIDLLACTREHWPLAGDQLFVDFDLSAGNAPPGTRLAIGAAVIEVTPEVHAGCAKFRARFGPDALKFVNSPLGKQLRLRGVNAKIVQPGVIRAGDRVQKL